MHARLLAALIVAGTVLAGPGTAAAATAATAATANESGTCAGGEFQAVPGSGARVAPGHTIRLFVTEVIRGDSSVLACSRDIRLSGPVEFVGGSPTAYYWPSTSLGPVAEVAWDGPFAPGTVLHGSVTLRVSTSAPDGAPIAAASGPTLTFTVR